MAQTIKEALIGMVNFPIPDSRVEKALTDSELDGSAIYAKTDEKAVDLAMAGLLLTLATSGNVSEGGYKRDMPSADSLRSLRITILNKWGIKEDLEPEVKEPTIYDGTGLW